MLPVEYVPTEKYMQVYREALKNYAKPVALAVGRLADKIIEKRDRTLCSSHWLAPVFQSEF